jgi:Uma2 family endonuclease
MSAREKDLRKYIEYPESDGQPMGETDKHILLMMNLRFVLDEFFRTTERVYVGSNLMCYYVEGNPTKSISPDVFVVRGAEKGERRIYKFWEEPAPQVVIELSSRKTRKADLTDKKDIYAWLGVREYYIFDPEYKLNPPFRSFRLHGQELIEEIVAGNRVMSHELGLELVNDGQALRLRNPQTGEFLRTPPEEFAAHRNAQVRVAQEVARADQETARAEQEAARARLETMRAQQEAARAQQEALRAQQEALRAQQEAARADRLAAKLRELGLDPEEI